MNKKPSELWEGKDFKQAVRSAARESNRLQRETMNKKDDDKLLTLDSWKRLVPNIVTGLQYDPTSEKEWLASNEYLEFIIKELLSDYANRVEKDVIGEDEQVTIEDNGVTDINVNAFYRNESKKSLRSKLKQLNKEFGIGGEDER